ncbi:MAG: sensor histidine kinase, partial [Bacteroidota bacterium]
KTSQFEDPDFKISTDQIRLEQVLSNLLHNALKFTDKGIIEFGFFIRDDNKLQFFVTDTGKGCKRDPLLFESFYRKHDNTSDQLPGAGLGLSISHGLVKLLGGTIWVEDNDYNGSTFNFTIPMSDDSELPSMGDNKRDNDYLHFVF